MTRLVTAVALAAVLVGTGATARAEDIVAYPADGDSDASAANARVEALDEAFGKAVAQAVGDLVDAQVRKQNKAAIDRELVGHARLWVAKFTVTKEAIGDDRKRVSASVWVDRDKLRARLVALNIATLAAKPSDAPAAGESATVLLRVAAPDGVHATYGRAAEPDVAGLAALSGALRRASYAIVRAPASGPAARAEGDLPLDDDAAEALAADARPALLAIAGVTIGAPVPLRGIDASGVLVTAHVRLIDRKAHKALGQSMVIGGSRGVDPVVVGAAIDRAVVAAVGDVLPRPANQAQAPVAMPSGEDAPIAEPGVVLIRLARATPWGLVQAELKHLIGARGVSSATLRHVSPAGWVIGVATSDSIDRVAAIVKRPPAADLTASVRILGSVVELALAGSTATP